MNDKRNSGIPTTVDGITYRSRTEARWGVLLNQLFPGRVEYEPFDADHYIPDFAVLGDRPILIEVKADVTLAELARHTERLDQALVDIWEHDVMIVGASPFLTAPDPDAAGLMRQDGHWTTALWMTCTECGSTGWSHQSGEWGAHPCGHYDGDHHIAAVDRDLIGQLWARAIEATKWVPPS